jgi:hypothetical protein
VAAADVRCASSAGVEPSLLKLADVVLIVKNRGKNKAESGDEYNDLADIYDFLSTGHLRELFIV